MMHVSACHVAVHRDGGSRHAGGRGERCIYAAAIIVAAAELDGTEAPGQSTCVPKDIGLESAESADQQIRDAFRGSRLLVGIITKACCREHHARMVHIVDGDTKRQFPLRL